ncbi:MAG TPA: SDR family NAD(P)-dependent oxidoreductase [Actinomycetes bacterium]
MPEREEDTLEHGPEHVALITGANRGIGFEVARRLARLGMTVILGARDLDKGRAAARPLVADGLQVLPRQLDVADGRSVERLAAELDAEFGRLDVLVNNAAILYDDWQRATDADLDLVRQAFETNTLGAWRTCRVLLPLLRRSAHGRIVNVSSESGSLAGMTGGTPAYSVSKAALNALTRLLGSTSALMPRPGERDLQGAGNSERPAWATVGPKSGDAGSPDGWR